ncbi:hypothetical protein [Mesorhizobium sp.]|uniref:hypothetical protein n=1 Tax=Mesorhizobium sp. TaxID=1871066 RepID=UPI0011F565E2|nr:hypothetical protein [Mesorhizobium sp.]TIV57051.1 MAG: hypothetical protein E5V80_24280 [Mesorhizobium sp.]
MASSVQDPDLLEQIFGSNALKAGLAAVTVFATLAKYIKESGQRRREASAISRRFQLEGSIPFLVIVRFPAIIHQIVAITTLILSILEIGFLADQYANQGRILSIMPPPVDTISSFIASWFVGLIMLAGAFYLFFELRTLESFLAWFVGLVPSSRQTLGWANAKWQITSDKDDRRILAPSKGEIEAAASRLIGEIVASSANTSLALRPAGLDNETAANILYFGHVFEAYRSAQGDRYSAWTDFYAALGQVALEPHRPFSAKSLKAWPQTKSFLSVMLEANEKLAADVQIPNDTGLEVAIEGALATLRRRWKSDARNISRGILGYPSYDIALQNSQYFVRATGMRRQFAKLFILWGLEPGAKRPAIFRIPFNGKMLIRYLDDEVLRAQGDHFDLESEPVEICFETVQREVVEHAFDLLTRTKDPTRSEWRAQEKARTEVHNIDWKWWIFYRVDTQAYYDARNHNSPGWKIEANREVVRA